jgi:Pyridoxamine 5'-phosphate oxidase
MLDQTFQDAQVSPVATLTLSEAALSSVCGMARGRGVCQPYQESSILSADVLQHRRHLGSDNNRAREHQQHSSNGDPESPLCARLTLTGELQILPEDSDEFRFAQTSLFQRHPQMKSWPADHHWQIAKLTNLIDVWLIDFFGGATIISPEDYFSSSF